MDRLRPPALGDMSPAQRSVYDAIVSGPRGQLGGPLGIWLHSPDLASPAQQLGAYCRYASKLPPRLSELAIITTAAHWRSRYEWWAHARFAREAGLESEIIDAIAERKEPSLTDVMDSAVFNTTHEILNTGRLSDVSFRAAENVLGGAVLVDLVGLVGYYTLVAFTLNAFDVSVPDGQRTPFD